MYCPAHFQVNHLPSLHALMAQSPLATLVRQESHGLVADHLPLYYQAVADTPGQLLGHVAKANPLWQTTAPLLVIFHGPQAYISPSWYPSKQENGKVVPTWNDAVVHVQATLQAIHDPQQCLAIVSRMTELHEAPFAQPWSISDAPKDYLAQMLTQIVGISLNIHQIEGKFKLSQNQPAPNVQGVVSGLATQQQHALLDWMSLL